MRVTAKMVILALGFWLQYSGASWAFNSHRIVRGEGGDETAGSVVIDNGNPGVASTDFTYDLYFRRSNDVNGATWGNPVLIDSWGENYLTSESLDMVNGRPAIAYTSGNFALQNDEDLKYVRALDPNGNTWCTPVVIDSFGATGFAPSLEVVNGRPAITFHSRTGNYIDYVRANDEDGKSWGTFSTIATGAGASSSLRVINGRPAVAFYKDIGDDLQYRRASNVDGTSWGTVLTLDSTGDVGAGASLFVVNGRPAILYADTTNQSLKYIRALDADGATWGVPQTLSPLGVFGFGRGLIFIDGNPAAVFNHSTSVSSAETRIIRALDVDGNNWGSPTVISNADLPRPIIVNGNPALFVMNKTTRDMEFMRSNDTSGTNWPSPLVVSNGDNSWSYGSDPFMIEVSGRAAIAYQNGGGLRYIRSDSADAATFPPSVIVDPTFLYNGALPTITMGIVGGKPAIVYYDSLVGMKYVRSIDPDGTAWGSSSIPDTATNVGNHASLAEVNGRPAISYYDVGNADLKFVRSLDANGDSWDTPVLIDSAGNVGQHTSQFIVNGNPAIAYYDATNGDLKYVRASDANGAIWPVPITVQLTGNVGSTPCLIVVNGLPAISYHDVTNGDLKFVRASDIDGNTWSAALTIDSANSVGADSHMAIINGIPAIAYYDSTNTGLKYVRAANGDGTVWNASKTIVDYGRTGTVNSLIETNGKAAISFANDQKRTFEIAVDLPQPDGIWDGEGNNGDSNWTTALNWSNDTVPSSTTDVIINGATQRAVLINVPVQVASLTITGGYQRFVSQNFQQNLTITGAITVECSSFGGSFGTSTITTGSVLIATCGRFLTPTNLIVNNHFANSGSFEVGSGETITFAGNGIQNFTLDVPTSFHHLTVGSNSILNETVAADNTTIAGTFTNNGILRKTLTISGAGAYSFGLTRANVQITTQGSLTSLRVDNRWISHPAAPAGLNTGKYWSITPTGTGYAADLTLPHNGVPDAGDTLCRYTGAGGVWSCAASSFNTVTQTITRTGIAKFSDWVTGNNYSGVAEAASSGDAILSKGAGTALNLTYSPSCSASNHVVYHGIGPITNNVVWSTSYCSLGTSGSAGFDPGDPAPGQLFYFVVVGYDATQESIYGVDSFGNPRPEASGIGACDRPQIVKLTCS